MAGASPSTAALDPLSLREILMFKSKTITAVAAALVLAASISGCSAVMHSVDSAASEARHTDKATTGPASESRAVVVANGHGWTASGLDGTVPASGACHVGGSAAGGELPDATCTPGSVDATVTQANISTTLGRSGGYTSSVRPPEAMIESAKRQLMAAYGIPWSEARGYELDHLVPLCAGGSSDVRNLWPEKNDFLTGDGGPSSYVHNSKDRVEAYVCSAIRTGQAPLGAAQQAMASNWTTAVATLRLSPIPSGYQG